MSSTKFNSVVLTKLNNQEQQLKELRLRLFLAETQINKITQIFDVQIETMQSQNLNFPATCETCGMDANSIPKGSCNHVTCPCGLN